MSAEETSAREQEQERVVIRDNRKIDKQPVAEGGVATPPPAAAGAGNDVPTADAVLLAERTSDLQRVQAEYANYRKRAERDRLLAGDLAVGRTLAELLPVIDDLDRAKAHDDLAGPLKAVADKLDGVFGKLGLVAFGAAGDPFDPSIHEAVLHDESDSVAVPTCTTIMRQGYTHKDRLLRPAMVGVTDPATPAPAPTETQSEQSASSEPLEPDATPHEDEVPAQPNPATPGE